MFLRLEIKAFTLKVWRSTPRSSCLFEKITKAVPFSVIVICSYINCTHPIEDSHNIMQVWLFYKQGCWYRSNLDHFVHTHNKTVINQAIRKDSPFVSETHICVCYNIYTPMPLNTLQQEPSTGYVLLETLHFSILYTLSLVQLHALGTDQ